MTDSRQEYVSFKNSDGTECGMTTLESWHDKPELHQVDVEGNPMIIVEIFSADDWDDAMIHHHNIMGFRTYKITRL